MPLPSASHPSGISFIELQSVDSTNKYAMDLVHAGRAEHGLAVFAHEQTAGKGQRGKQWSTGKNMNIALSVVANPYPLQPADVFQLSACAAVAAHHFVCQYAGEETKIKWPNDIYWRDRKAGGILIENVISSGKKGSGNWYWAVIGTGININQTSFPENLPNPVSLKQITGKNFDPLTLAKELRESIINHLGELTSTGFKNIFNTYQQLLYKRNERVRLKKDNRIFEVIMKGVTVNGQLIVQHSLEEQFEFGTVEWIH